MKHLCRKALNMTWALQQGGNVSPNRKRRDKLDGRRREAGAWEKAPTNTLFVCAYPGTAIVCFPLNLTNSLFICLSSFHTKVPHLLLLSLYVYEEDVIMTADFHSYICYVFFQCYNITFSIAAHPIVIFFSLDIFTVYNPATLFSLLGFVFHFLLNLHMYVLCTLNNKGRFYLHYMVIFLVWSLK